jgi:cell wall-associated NlpC family hydrolase
MSLLVAMALLAVAPAGVVVKSVANMYAEPSEEADVVSQAIFGSNIALLEEKNGWVKVRTADEYSGWMRSDSIRSLRESERPYALAGPVAQVGSLFANLYREPDITTRRPILTVPFETRLEVISEPEMEERRWLEVRLPADRSAWIQRGDVTIDSGPESIDAVVTLAQRFLGLPYLWGGTSSFGYDCSGFTQMLCRRRGVTLPRDAALQAHWKGVVPIARSEVQPGDLVFFGESMEKITHSGMYIGGGQFIHATAYKRPVVQISRLDDQHWAELLVACRRLK